jgi:hypothetical protein
VGLRNVSLSAFLAYNGAEIAAEEESMLADRVEVSWDAPKSQWLIRITEGEEVIRRHLDLPKNAEDQALRAAALETVRDEGYEFDASKFTIQR